MEWESIWESIFFCSTSRLHDVDPSDNLGTKANISWWISLCFQSKLSLYGFPGIPISHSQVVDIPFLSNEVSIFSGFYSGKITISHGTNHHFSWNKSPFLMEQITISHGKKIRCFPASTLSRPVLAGFSRATHAEAELPISRPLGQGCYCAPEVLDSRALVNCVIWLVV